LFEIDEKDEVLLAEAFPERGDGPMVIKIVDHQVPAEKSSGNLESSEAMIGASFRWTKRFPKVVHTEENPPDKDVGEWRKVMIHHESLPSPATVFVDVCKVHELINDILVPQSTFYMHQKKRNCLK